MNERVALKKLGKQPLDEVMTNLELKAEDLVKCSTEQLTFKQVKKAREGIRVTSNIRQKIRNALNGCVGEEKFTLKDLFSYK